MQRTSKLKLTQYEISDRFSITEPQDSINADMEIIDDQLGGLQESLCTVLQRGVEHGVIPKGKLVFVRNSPATAYESDAISTGFYITTQRIAAGTELRSTWLSMNILDLLSRVVLNFDNSVMTGQLSRGRANGDGAGSIAFGFGTTAMGDYSQAFGAMTYALGRNAQAFGRNNIPEVVDEKFIEIEANVDYVFSPGGLAKYDNKYYVAKLYWSGSGSSFDTSCFVEITDQNKEFLELVGNGVNNPGGLEYSFSNARALDKDGNEYLNGDLHINCDDDSRNGKSVGDALKRLNLDGVESISEIKQAAQNNGDVVIANGVTPFSTIVGLGTGASQGIFTRVISSTANRLDFVATNQSGKISVGKIDISNNDTLTYHLLDIDNTNSGTVKYVDVQIASRSYTSGTFIKDNIAKQSGETDVGKRIAVSPLNNLNIYTFIAGQGRIAFLPNATQTTALTIRIWYVE